MYLIANWSQGWERMNTYRSLNYWLQYAVYYSSITYCFELYTSIYYNNILASRKTLSYLINAI